MVGRRGEADDFDGGFRGGGVVVVHGDVVDDVLVTICSLSGVLRHDIHYWLGKDTSQDESATAAIKTVELDATLGGRAVQYREVQGHETDKFLSYFKPCIIPKEGRIEHAEINGHVHCTRLFVCKGKHAVYVKEVLFTRSSLNHDNIFILDTESKIFQFNGFNSSIQERAKALEVVQYIKNTHHDGECEVAAVEDGKLMADADAGEFWGFFGGFAPLPRKTASENDTNVEAFSAKLFCVEEGKSSPILGDSLTRGLLCTNMCYLLDCGAEVYVWMGRNTSLEQRRGASSAAEKLLIGDRHTKAHLVRVIEGFETVMFRSKFDAWPEASGVVVSADGRGKVAALLKHQGLDVKGLLKAVPVKEPHPYIDCTGNLQVWRVNGQEKTLLSSHDQSKFYCGGCYIFQYSYPGKDRERYLIGTWFGNKSIEEERVVAISLASKTAKFLKSQAVRVRLYEGKEPTWFFAIFQSLVLFRGGVSSGYKKFITENNVTDETYTEKGLALFRVQGSGPDNMQAIQVEPVASSLNSSYCYILHSGDTVFTWSGSLATSDDHELLERQLDLIKPNVQSKPQKEGTETAQFWALLGVKCEFASQKIAKIPEKDPHLFCCAFLEDDLKVTEIHNFDQDDLTTEDVYILDCHSEIFVWVGQEVDSKIRFQALNIGEKYLQHDFLMENQSQETPVYVIMEGSEPQFFTRFFIWDSAKSSMHGNSFQRKFALVKNGVIQTLEKPKRRIPIPTGRSTVPETSQCCSRRFSFSPEKVRARGRSPAFNALASKFENPTARTVSTPPPAVRTNFPKSFTANSLKLPPKSATIAALTASFESARKNMIPKSAKVSTQANKPNGIESLIIQKAAKKGEAGDDGIPTIPYEQLKTASANPITEIDVTKRESYLSSVEFEERFGMTKDAFYKLPRWKQNKLKIGLHLF